MNMPTPEEVRAVPLEMMRTWFVDRCELASIRTVAADVGLGRTTLHKFVAGNTDPHPRVRRLLAVYYLRMRDGGGEQSDVRAALDLLAAYVPPAARPGLLAELIAAMRRGFLAAGLDVPPWLEQLP